MGKDIRYDRKRQRGFSAGMTQIKKRGLARYKDPASTIKKRNDYNATHYRSYHIRLSYTKDKDMIDELEKDGNYVQTVREWFKESR